MKKIILCILSFLLCVFSQTHAQIEWKENILGKNQEIVTYTSEHCNAVGQQNVEEKCTYLEGKEGDARYLRCECRVKASDGFIGFIAGVYKYIFFISLIVGVLMVVILGITISVSGLAEEEMQNTAKTKIIEILLGLFALAIIPWILKTVAPFFFI